MAESKRRRCRERKREINKSNCLRERKRRRCREIKRENEREIKYAVRGR